MADIEILLDGVRAAQGHERGITAGVADDEILTIADHATLRDQRAAVEGDDAVRAVGRKQLLDLRRAAGEVELAGVGSADIQRAVGHCEQTAAHIHHIVGGPGNGADRQIPGDRDRAAVGERQRVARPVAAHGEVAADAPDRAGARDGDRVAVGPGYQAEAAVTAIHRAAGGDRQRVAGPEKTHIEAAAVAPDRSGARDHDRIAVGPGVEAEEAGTAEHLAAIGNRQRVAHPGVAHVEAAAVAPDRSGARDQGRIAMGPGAAAEETGGIE